MSGASDMASILNSGPFALQNVGNNSVCMHLSTNFSFVAIPCGEYNGQFDMFSTDGTAQLNDAGLEGPSGASGNILQTNNHMFISATDGNTNLVGLPNLQSDSTQTWEVYNLTVESVELKGLGIYIPITDKKPEVPEPIYITFPSDITNYLNADGSISLTLQTSLGPKSQGGYPTPNQLWTLLRPNVPVARSVIPGDYHTNNTTDSLNIKL